MGEILLKQDDDFEFNPFEWAQVSAMAHRQTLAQMADLQARISSEQETIAKLNAQLEDFIKTKNETETAMLQQFMELLNEKKRKIRDQSRLLAGAKIDKESGMWPCKTYEAFLTPSCSHRCAGDTSWYQDTQSRNVTNIEAQSSRTSSRA